MPRPRPDAPTGPRRTCVGCGRVADAGDLVRLVRRADASLAVGRTLPGRGAWLCPGSPSCIEGAIRRGGFARSFRATVSRAAVEAVRSQVCPEQPSAATSPFVPGAPAARDSTTVPETPGNTS